MTTNLTQHCQKNLLHLPRKFNFPISRETTVPSSLSSSLQHSLPYLIRSSDLAIYFTEKIDFCKMRTTSSSHQQVLYCICTRTKILCLPHPQFQWKKSPGSYPRSTPSLGSKPIFLGHFCNLSVLQPFYFFLHYYVLLLCWVISNDMQTYFKICIQTYLL